MEMPDYLDYKHGLSLSAGDSVGGQRIVKMPRHANELRLGLASGDEVRYYLRNDDRGELIWALKR